MKKINILVEYFSINFQTAKGKFFNDNLFMDSVWSLIGHTVSKSLAFVAGIIVARILGSDDFGQFGIVRNTFLVAASFSSFGLGYSITWFISSNLNTNKERIIPIIKIAFCITLILSSILAFFLSFFAKEIITKLDYSHHLIQTFKNLSVIVVFNSFITTQTGIISGLGKFKEQANVNIFLGIFTFFVTLILTYKLGFNGALFSLFAVQLFTTIVYSYQIWSFVRYFPKVSSGKINTLVLDVVKFSIPIAFQESTYYVLAWIGSILLINHGSFSELGLFTAAMHWNSFVLFIPTIVTSVTLTHLSSVDRFSEKMKLVKKSIFITLLPIIFFLFVVSIFSESIENYYGSTFHGLSILINISIFCSIFSSVSSIFSQLFLISNRNWIVLFLRLFRDAGILLTFYLFMEFSIFYGAKALVISTLLMNFIYMLALTFCLFGLNLKTFKKLSV